MSSQFSSKQKLKI